MDLYLTGIYFLIAVLSNDTGLENRAGPSERWAEAFGSDRRQVASLLSNMTSAFAYGRIVTDDDGRPIDFIFLYVNEAYGERSLGSIERTCWEGEQVKRFQH